MISGTVQGVLRPEIVVPAWLTDAPVEQQRIAILHELEHRRAGDTRLLTAAAVALVFLPWNPLVWWMHRRLRAAIEIDCDRRVLRRGIPRRSYGTFLIDIAARPGGMLTGAAVPASTRSTLERRLTAMTQQNRPARFVGATILAIAGCGLIVTACETPVPTSAQIEEMDISSAEALLARAGVDADGAIFYIDGVQVTRGDAEAISADRLHRITVNRANDATSAIEIWTNAAAADAPRTFRVQRVASDSILPENLSILADSLRVEGVRRIELDADALDSIEIIRGAAIGQGFEVPDSVNRVVVVRTQRAGGDPLFLLDGQRIEESRIRKLDPSKIRSIEVIKAPAAVKLFDDPDAANGVIIVESKRLEDTQ